MSIIVIASLLLSQSFSSKSMLTRATNLLNTCVYSVV